MTLKENSALACPICASKTTFIDHHSFGRYHRCVKCEFIVKNRADQLDKKDQVKIYSNHNNSIEDKHYVDYFYHFLEAAVFPYVKGKKALDFGSGPSPVLAQILSTFHDFDMDIYDLFFAPEKIYQGKKYDLITCTEVMEHIDQPKPYFELFAKHLKEDGILSIMTSHSPKTKEDFMDWYYIRDKSHIGFYNEKNIAYLAKDAGLEIIYQGHNRYTSFQLKS